MIPAGNDFEGSTIFYMTTRLKSPLNPYAAGG